jgi:arginine decarboxylase
MSGMGGARNPGEGAEALIAQIEALDVDQPSAPYLDALVAVGFRGSTRFHVPGHKGGEGADPGLRHAIGDGALALDLPQDVEGIDVGPGPTPYQRAEELAAQAHGAGRTWFLTNGATQGNHALCLALAGPGAEVVVQRNSHASLIDGLVLSGGMPIFVTPHVEEEIGMAHGVTPEALAAALERAPRARAAFVVSPTYYGFAADVAGLAEVAHAADAALVVDQAWGPHFGFHPGVPPSALALGADAVLTSTHKIVGSLTQSAMLHLAGDGRIDPDLVARGVRLVRSTSPSSLLLGSLDAARRQLAVHGEALLERTLHAAALAVAAIDAAPGVRVIGEDMVGQPGVAARDPLRVVIDVRGTGCTGYEVAAALVAAYDVKVEMAAHAVIVLVLGLDQPVRALERFAHDFDVVVRRISKPGAPQVAIRPPAAAGTAVVSPRTAFLGDAEVVPVAEAVGRVSCEAIAGYPPGIPALLPGDRITSEIVDYLRELVEVGARLHGASDPAFETVYVLRDEPPA